MYIYIYKKRILIIFYNIIFFTVYFDQINAALVSINDFQKLLTSESFYIFLTIILHNFIYFNTFFRKTLRILYEWSTLWI